MAEVNGTDHLVRHEKESKLNGYDNEGYHCQERSDDEEESASDDDRLRVVVTENGHRPEDDSHISNGYMHDEINAHPTTVNGSAVIVIEENKSDSNMNDNRDDCSQKPLDTRLHHYVPVDDIDRKILNGSDGTHVTIPEDAVINFTTGRVKVKKGSSNNSQMSNERESIPLETMLPSYEAEDKIGLGEKAAELEAELTNHKNGLWSEGHNTYSNAESPFGNSEKLNGTSKSSDEISLPVNNHRKCLSSDMSDTSSEQKSTGEKLYFTEESRKLCPGWRRVFVCGLILIIIAVALLLGVLAATGILLAESESKNSRYESGHSLPSIDSISQAGHSFRPKSSFNKVPQKFLTPVSEGTNTTIDPVSRTSSPAVSSKVPVLNDTSHSQTIVPNALVGEFTIDENFTDDLKDNSSYGYQSLAKYIERELHGIFKRNGGVFETLKILSFSPGSIKIKFVTIWASDRNVILSSKAEEIFKSYLRKNRNSLLAYPVELDTIHFIDVFDECRVQKGGCSFNCMWDYKTLSKTCICGENMILLADGKSCGPKPSTNAFETTTSKFSNTPVSTTDQSLIEESPKTTEGQDESFTTTAVIPTTVAKAIISITELFHNLTSTELPVPVTESTISLLNTSIVVNENFPSDVRTTTNPHTSEELTTTEMSVNSTNSPGIYEEMVTETPIITDSSVNENTETDNILFGSGVNETDTHFYTTTIISTTIPEPETTSSSIMLLNDSVGLTEQPTTQPETTHSHDETTTNLPLTTEHDLTTIGYHIKEETAETYTIKDNTEFMTLSEFDTTIQPTEEPTESITNTKEITVFPNPIAETTITTEVAHSITSDMPKNASEVTEINITGTPDNQITDINVTTESSEAVSVNPTEGSTDDINSYANVTETGNEETTSATHINFTSSNDISNETNFQNPDEINPLITTTFLPLTTPHTNRSPEVRSFDDDSENETTTESIHLNSTDNFMNDSSLETSTQPDINEISVTHNSITTTLPTTEPHAETNLFESTTEKSSVSEKTTHIVPINNIPVTNTEKSLTETTIATEFFSNENTETTEETEITSSFITESSHINKNHIIMNGVLDTTTIVFENETITILPIETETHTTSEVIETNNTAEAENVTLENSSEINTTLTSLDITENSTIYTSNEFGTTENFLHDEKTTTSFSNETSGTNIPDTTAENSESSIHANITDNNINEEAFNSSFTLNITNDEFLLITTSEPMNVSDELTTLEDINTFEDSDLTSLETSNFSNSNTEFPNNVTPTESSDFNETLTSATSPDSTLPTPPYPNGSEIEVTTEPGFNMEMFTFGEYDNETSFPFDMESNFTNTTDIPFESSFLGINSSLIPGSNESLENSTFFSEFDNFTTEGYDASNETTTNASTGIECREDQFLCEPLNRCINDTFMCDGIEDCPDGIDEFECKDGCHSNFMCPNSTTCIMSEARCDGIWDCENGTDEDNCSPTECAQHEVMCLDHSKCIKPGHICDWKYNCLDRSDEVGCVERTTCESNGRFFCNDGLCIPWSLKCDGENDCKEGEDEGNCTCLSDEFQCNDGKCLKSSSRCDGHQDCHDADDEMGCVTVDNQHIVSTYEPYSGTWGLLCAEDWNLDDGQYLCQELGFGHALNVERIHVSFNGTWMAMRRENLTEASLWTERVSFVESCTSGLAAAVECQKFVCGEYTGLLHRRRRDVISTASNQWPFIGYTSTFQSNRGCLSEILTPIWLITSAECLLSISKEPFNGSDWYVRTNLGRDVEADLAQNHEVLRIINHPHSSKFRSLTLRDYDVALIRLKHALVFVSDKIGAICPPEEQVPPGITCFSGVLGTEKPRSPPPPLLAINSLALQIMDRRNCNRVEHYNNAINHRMLCTQSSEGHTICDNDEGTPLMCLTGINKWFLAGMLTYQRFCDVYSKHPAVYSNLFSMRKFLDQVTGQKQYEVSYDSSMYIIIPPTTPSPTMPETTTPEMMTLSTTEFPLMNTTYLIFENETETVLGNLEEINGTTEIGEEFIREENYTTVLPEELINLLNVTTVSEDFWNETITTTPYEMDSDVFNATLDELEKSTDEVLENRTYDDLKSYSNDTYSSDDIINGTTISDVVTEFDNNTILPIIETTTVSNMPVALELNDSFSTTTEFVTSVNETAIVTTEMSADVTKMDAPDMITEAAITTHSSLTSLMNDSANYSEFTTSPVDLTPGTDLIPELNETVEMVKPAMGQTNESKIISQPLIALIDDTKEIEKPIGMVNVETLENNTENIGIGTTLTESHSTAHHLETDSETTLTTTMDITEFNKNATAETTTQSTLDETESVTFVLEGEPDVDLTFSLFKKPDGLKLESYRMLEDNEFTDILNENTSSSLKQDANVSFSTENEMTLKYTVTTTFLPEHFTNTENHGLIFDNATDSFTTESISSTSSNTDFSRNSTSEVEIKSDNINKSTLLTSNTTENYDLIFETIKEELKPKSGDPVHNNLNYSMPLSHEDISSIDMLNKSSLFFPNKTERNDLVFLNMTEKTVPKSSGLITDDLNYSVPLAFEDDLKSDIEINSSSLLLSNEAEEHDLIFYNVTDKIIPTSTSSVTDNTNYSFPVSFKDDSKSSNENSPVPSSNTTEKPTLKFYNETGGSVPELFDSVTGDENYSVPFTFKNDTKAESIVNESLFHSDKTTENQNTDLNNKSEEVVPKSTDLIVDDINHSIHVTVESDDRNASSHSHNFTENYDLEFDSESKEIVPKSEDVIRDDINQSISMIIDGNSVNSSPLSYTSDLTTEHDMITENVDLMTENMTSKIIPKSADSDISSTINFSVPLYFGENGISNSMNDSSIDNTLNKTIPHIFEPELDIASVDDSTMKMHLTTQELKVLPENNTMFNTSDCGIWAENSAVLKSDNQNPFKVWPAIGYLQFTSEAKKCPSTVISPNYVITSLNCLISSNMDLGMDPDQWTYVGGSHKSDTVNGMQTLAIHKIIPYPGKFLLLNEHDVALVRLNDTIDMNEYSKSACVAQSENIPGKECFTAGWNTNTSDGDVQNQLYSFPLKIITIDECNNTMNYNGMLIDNLLCGVREKENTQNCYMNFGSPLFCQNENKQWELQGILNRPDPCDTDKPIVFSDILSVKEWIDETLINDDLTLDRN